MTETFNEDYFLRGKESGLSNYIDYRWLPDQTIPMAEAIVGALGIERGSTILDYGCARGYLVRAMRSLGMSAYGVDVSKWAIENSDPQARDYVAMADELPNLGNFKWVISKDTLEHVERDRLHDVSKALIQQSTRGVLVVVPLRSEDGDNYVAPQDQADHTHQTKWTLSEWLTMFENIASDTGEKLLITGGFRMNGLKQLAEPYPKSTGFIIIRHQ